MLNNIYPNRNKLIFDLNQNPIFPINYNVVFPLNYNTTFYTNYNTVFHTHCNIVSNHNYTTFFNHSYDQTYYYSYNQTFNYSYNTFFNYCCNRSLNPRKLYRFDLNKPETFIRSKPSFLKGPDTLHITNLNPSNFISEGVRIKNFIRYFNGRGNFKLENFNHHLEFVRFSNVTLVKWRSPISDEGLKRCR